MGDDVRISGLVGRDDYREYYREALRRITVSMRLANYLIVIILTVIALILGVELPERLVERSHPELSETVGAVALGAFFVGYGLSVAIYYSSAMLARRHQVRDDGLMLGFRVFKLGDEGIHVEGDHGHAMTKWSTITEMSETKRTMIFWTDPAIGVLVPKAAMGDDHSINNFRAFVAVRIGKTG